MTDSKPISKKQQAQNLKDLYTSRDAAHERQWLRGNKTAMEKDIIGAGRQSFDAPAKKPTKEKE